MKRIAALLGFVCLFALFSCKKDALETPATDFSNVSSKSLALTTINGVQVQTDTIPPTNAVDVKKYGAVGDGVHDDTQALQNAINAQSTLVFNGGTYIINQSLLFRSGVKLYGKNGATIKAGNSMSGTLLNRGWYFNIQNLKSNWIINLNFAPPTQAFQLGAWSNAIIYIKNSQYTSIQYNRFNFKQPYQHTGVEAVWVDGPSSLQTFINHNTCNTVGIEYAEYGACGTICQFNTINNSHSNALSADGNGGIYCKGNRVLYNTINNAGYNGINDYGTVDGTLIRGNVINGSGKSPSEGALGEGIQAVAVNTIVSLNTIKDAMAEYIEVGFCNKKIDSNTIIDTKLVSEGIVVNTVVGSNQANATSSTTILDHNNITGCNHAIELVGGYTPSVLIKNNKITNPKAVGIAIINTAASYNLTVTGNTLTFSNPNAQARQAIMTYPTTLTNSQLVTLSSNAITYTSGANGGASRETAIATGTNNVTLNGNSVTGNYVKSSGGLEVAAMNCGNSTFSGYSFVNNQFNSCAMWLSGYQTVTKTGNNF